METALDVLGLFFRSAIFFLLALFAGIASIALMIVVLPSIGVPYALAFGLTATKLRGDEGGSGS